MSKVVYSSNTTTVDHETGEVMKEVTSNVIQLPVEPPYVKMYINDLCSLIGLHEAQKSLLMLLLRKLDYEGYIVVTGRFKALVCAELNIQDGTFRNRLSALVKSGLLAYSSRTEYRVNPNFFARGNWKDIIEQRKNFEMVVSYGPKGRKIETRLTKEPDRDPNTVDLFDELGGGQ